MNKIDFEENWDCKYNVIIIYNYLTCTNINIKSKLKKYEATTTCYGYKKLWTKVFFNLLLYTQYCLLLFPK